MKKNTTIFLVVLILAAFVLLISAPVQAAVSDKQKDVRNETNEMKETEKRYETEVRQITLNRHTVYNWNGSVVSVTQDPAPRNFTYLFDSWTETNSVTEQLDPFFSLTTDFIKDVFVFHNVVYQITWNNTSSTLPRPQSSDPVVLDLNYDGKIDVANNVWQPHDTFYKSHMRFFDINGDGAMDATEWLAPGTGDGMLCTPSGKGIVETALDLFGTAEGFDDGLQKLSVQYDTDKNGWVEGEELAGLALWIDKNADGVCEKSEIKTLAECKVSRIATGRSVTYVGSYESTDGQVRKLWNWWPTTSQTVRSFPRG